MLFRSMRDWMKSNGRENNSRSQDYSTRRYRRIPLGFDSPRSPLRTSLCASGLFTSKGLSATGQCRSYSIPATFARNSPSVTRTTSPGSTRTACQIKSCGCRIKHLSALEGRSNEENRGTHQWKPGWRLAKSSAGGGKEIVRQQPVMMSHPVQRQVKKDEAILTKKGAREIPIPHLLSGIIAGAAQRRGKTLSPAERHLFEPRVGCDLNGASFQADRRAGKLARVIQVRALTDGRDWGRVLYPNIRSATIRRGARATDVGRLVFRLRQN